MASFQSQFDNPQGRPTEYDEYGNPVMRTADEFGNPIGQHGMAGTGVTAGGEPLNLGGHHEGAGGVLRRSGSSSSSSSEDDGQGGRRKKGIKEKIKEKIPGVGHKHGDQTQASTYGTTTAGGYGGEYGQPHEKKGMMDKIKEKLPGHHGH
ncbi:hypothetical protein MLD38_007782 [Melastoma candidum]|uniref:Uncharacterized protein n=1 Tax=Melastoma candidum TaxID=119954 RepID=A0ACB9RRN6_9MYRT|nr:hypothetical protein MLD38_007782 [Melastoma candidum]